MIDLPKKSLTNPDFSGSVMRRVALWPLDLAATLLVLAGAVSAVWFLLVPVAGAQQTGAITYHASQADARSGANPITSLDIKQGETESYWVRLSVGGDSVELAPSQRLSVSLPAGADAAISNSSGIGEGWRTRGTWFWSPDHPLARQLQGRGMYEGPKRVWVYLSYDAGCRADSEPIRHSVGGQFPASSLTLNYICPQVSFASAEGHHHEHDGGSHDHNHNPHDHTGSSDHAPHEHNGSGMHTHGHPTSDHGHSAHASFATNHSHEHDGTRHFHNYQHAADRIINGRVAGHDHGHDGPHTHTHTSTQIPDHSHPGGNIVETFKETTRLGAKFEYRFTEYEVVLNVDPAPTRDIYVRFRYHGTAEWFRRTMSLVSTGSYMMQINGEERHLPLYETHPWTGDYYIAHNGAPNQRCLDITSNQNKNCGAVNGRAWVSTRIPAGATRHTLKIRVWDDDVHDSGETVVLELGQGWHQQNVPDKRVVGTHYALGSQTTHTLTILNDEPPPEPEPEEDPNVPPPPDLDAPAPAKASAEVLWNRSVLVGWPSAAGVSKYHVRARSGNGHGTRWGYHQTGSWYVFEGLQTGTWVIEVFDAGNWTPVTDWLIVNMPKKGQEPDPPKPPDQTTQPEQPKTPTPAPTVTITAGSGVTEGGVASFTVTANPAPTTPLTVLLSVSQSGDYTATTGTRTVTIPTGGTATVSIATVDDSADEADGSVTVTLSAGTGYTVGSSSTATVVVADNDDPPVVTPTVSIAAGSGVTEGGVASFTVTASPAPTTALTVTVDVSQSGDYTATTGTRTVTIPTGGTATYSVVTVDDSADEADGSVTVTLSAGNGYTVGSSSSATVAVADNDDPPVPATPSVCVTTDTALLSQVEAKVTRHANETGRTDLHEMFSRSLNTMKGVDTYTTAALKARPDKQGAKWQGAGPNPMWQAVYAELDRLETCRAAQ